MNKGIYRIAAGIGAAVILVSSCTVQASMVMTNGTPAAVATDSIANWPGCPGCNFRDSSSDGCRYRSNFVR